MSVNAVASDNSKAVIMATVRHFQAVTKALLKPRVAAEKCGSIICAHCPCMAGWVEAKLHEDRKKLLELGQC